MLNTYVHDLHLIDWKKAPLKNYCTNFGFMRNAYNEIQNIGNVTNEMAKYFFPILQHYWLDLNLLILG